MNHDLHIRRCSWRLRVTRRVPTMVQAVLTQSSSAVDTGARFAQSLIFWLFVNFSIYSFDIFKLCFLNWKYSNCRSPLCSYLYSSFLDSKITYRMLSHCSNCLRPIVNKHWVICLGECLLLHNDFSVQFKIHGRKP